MNAPSSHGVAAAPLSPDLPQSNRERASFPAMWRTAARRVAGILRFLTDIHAGFIAPCINTVRVSVAKATRGVVGWFGDNEYVEGYYCAICDDVHPTNYRCRRELIGFCDDCKRTRKLTRAGLCVCGSSAVTDRKQRWAELPARIRRMEEASNG